MPGSFRARKKNKWETNKNFVGSSTVQKNGVEEDRRNVFDIRSCSWHRSFNSLVSVHEWLKWKWHEKMPLGAVISEQKCSRHQCDGTAATTAYPLHYASSFTSILQKRMRKRQVGSAFVRLSDENAGPAPHSCLFQFSKWCANARRASMSCKARVDRGHTVHITDCYLTIFAFKLAKSNKSIELWTSQHALTDFFFPLKVFRIFYT